MTIRPSSRDSARTARWSALLWLLAGAAFLTAGLLSDRRQPAFFAVATVFCAVSVITARRGRRV